MEKLFTAFLLAILLAGCTQTSKPTSSASAIAVLPDASSLSLELARTSSEQQAGLSSRPSLCQTCGMLFVFDSDDYHAFWMKGMRFALDIIYLDENYAVVDIIEDAHPCSTDCQIYRPGAPARYVLEVNAGYAQLHPLAKGSRINITYS